eukprot:ctg_1234.g271
MRDRSGRRRTRAPARGGCSDRGESGAAVAVCATGECGAGGGATAESDVIGRWERAGATSAARRRPCRGRLGRADRRGGGTSADALGGATEVGATARSDVAAGARPRVRPDGGGGRAAGAGRRGGASNTIAGMGGSLLRRGGGGGMVDHLHHCPDAVAAGAGAATARAAGGTRRSAARGGDEHRGIAAPGVDGMPAVGEC